VVAEARSRGIRNILALRGDPPPGAPKWVAPEADSSIRRELVEFLKAEGGFSIGTAGFPEGHVAQIAGKQVDWEYLRDKVEAGRFRVTQLFFRQRRFVFEFREYLTERLGVKVPIIPGILPVVSRGQTKRCDDVRRAAPGAVPRADRGAGDDDAAVTAFGIEYAARQCAELLREGRRGCTLHAEQAHSRWRCWRRWGWGKVAPAPPLLLEIRVGRVCRRIREARRSRICVSLRTLSRPGGMGETSETSRRRMVAFGKGVVTSEAGFTRTCTVLSSSRSMVPTTVAPLFSSKVVLRYFSSINAEGSRMESSRSWRLKRPARR